MHRNHSGFRDFLQHRLFHAIPLLWRFHRVHHTDLDYDLTTGFRFHLIKIVISMFIKITVICLIGAPVIAVLIFEIVLNAMAMFNHGNIKLNGKLDAILRTLIVTPDMHSIHHSNKNGEANSNFGFNFSLWDKIFRTYKAKAKHIQFGEQGFESKNECIQLLTLLKQPSIK
ncbi:MAG: sterol desaturase/sphingolipid hydroxylase (fatty acid hydroxylase superfamily) [Flavobacterium sp.]